MPNRSLFVIVVATLLATPVGAQDCNAACLTAVRKQVEELMKDNATGLPAGTVIAYAGAGLPGGFLVADGSTLLAIDPQNVAICAALGDRFRRADDPVGTCRLPDMTGRVAIGVRDGSLLLGKQYGGEGKLRLEVKNLPAHTHSLTPAVYQFAGSAVSFFGSRDNSVVAGFPYVDNHGNDPDAIVKAGRASRVASASVGDGEPVDILPPAVALRYLIKR